MLRKETNSGAWISPPMSQMTTNLQERYPDTLAEGESAILAETNGFIKRLCRARPPSVAGTEGRKEESR